MSNHLAIATVTATLQTLLQKSVEDVNGAAVIIGRPTAPASNTERKVHLYLYQVTPNAALREADLPTRNAEGRLAKRPQAALDVHYLITFYGDNSKFEPDRMLGSVVRDMHARPILSREAIRNAITSNNTVLGQSNLDVAVEHVKFTPLQISLEEMSKLWSVLVQIPHALSIAYVGTVVLIEAEETPAASLPVLQRGKGDRGIDSRVGPFPHLDRWWIGDADAELHRPKLPSLPVAQLGMRLRISGGDLGADALRLRFTHAPFQQHDTPPVLPPIELPIAPTERDGNEIRSMLPDDAAAQSAWAAGIYGFAAIVVRGNDTYPTGTLALALGPRVTKIDPNPAVRGADGSVTVKVTCRPRVISVQPAVLVVGEREITAEPFAGSTDVLTFVITKASPVNGALLRLRIDGVESLPYVFDKVSGGFVFDDQQRMTIQ